jgi:single-strand DNA-binding protein
MYLVIVRRLFWPLNTQIYNAPAGKAMHSAAKKSPPMRVVFFASALPAIPTRKFQVLIKGQKRYRTLRTRDQKFIKKFKSKIMEITGRLVADAIVRKTNNEKELTGFRVAINRRYMSNGDQVEDTTYVDCSFWRSTAIAPYLTKGMVVQLYGHMSASAWLDKDGGLHAGLNFHVNELTMLTASGAKSETKKSTTTSTRRSNRANAGLEPSKDFN